MKLIKKAGLTKVELAQRLGLNPNTIYKWKELPRPVELYLECLIECRDLADMKDIIERQRSMGR